jgi:hypothetical protein
MNKLGTNHIRLFFPGLVITQKGYLFLITMTLITEFHGRAKLEFQWH